jgi:hypothetical protein
MSSKDLDIKTKKILENSLGSVMFRLITKLHDETLAHELSVSDLYLIRDALGQEISYLDVKIKNNDGSSDEFTSDGLRWET